MSKRELLEQYKNKLVHDTYSPSKEYIEEKIKKLEDEIILEECEFYEQYLDELESDCDDVKEDILKMSNDGSKILYEYTLDYVFTENDSREFIPGRVSRYLYAKSIKEAYNLFLHRFRKSVDITAVIYIAHITEVHKNRE